MAVAVASRLTLEEQDAVRWGGDLPTHRPEINEAYAQLRISVRKWLQDKVGTPEHELPSADAIRKAAQRWTIKLLRCGNVEDDAAHEKGYKMTPERRDTLKSLYDLLIVGFTTGTGRFPYRSVKHGVAMSREIAELVQKLGVLRPETVWELLKDEFPDLYKGKWLTKKQRDLMQTMVST